MAFSGSSVQSQPKPSTGEGIMLFNKKAEEEFMQDYSTNKRSSTTVSSTVEPAAATSRKANGAPTRSVIDAWLTITGNLQSEGEVQVDGQIQGDIRCAHLTVGRDATVNGNITAEEVVVRGKVTGTIRANRVILQDSAHVESEIFHKKLSIEEGACFEGMSRRREDPLIAEMPDVKPMINGNGKYHAGQALSA
jgi:cytoskeletal protein CcmA (bactofilin family)